MRDHQPITLETFNGLWRKGDPEDTPPDHFSDCNNVSFLGVASFQTRPGVGLHQNVLAPLGNIVRMYNYITQDKNTLIVLTYNTTTNTGSIYHVIDGTTVFGPLLSIVGMTDFAFVAYAGRAYISPFSSFLTGGLNIEKGLQNEFLYVYKGDGTAARKAGANAPTGTIAIANGAAGNTDPGFKLFGVVFETDTGYLSPPAAFNSFTTSAAQSVSFSSIPVSVQAFVTKRHIVATKTIINYNGNTTGYIYYFIPNAILNDNVTTTLPDISFFDIDLLDDASELLDNFAEIPAGAGLTLYHNRLILYTTFTDISLAYCSLPGEPEAFDQVDGLIVAPLDGNPITNANELRDIFYVNKRNRTLAYSDNGDVPSSWGPPTVIDQAIGAPIHGVATFIDSGSTSVNYLIMASYKGIVVFNGVYALPELSWKIADLWNELDRNEFRKIQFLNDSIGQLLYIVLPTGILLVGDYNNGLDPKNIRWTKWEFNFNIRTIALVNINELIIGAGL